LICTKCLKIIRGGTKSPKSLNALVFLLQFKEEMGFMLWLGGTQACHHKMALDTEFGKEGSVDIKELHVGLGISDSASARHS
jgi:hypothetical protein